MGGSIEFFMLIILTKVIFAKNRFLYPKTRFFEKIDPKGRPKYSSRDEGTKIFLSDMKVQDQILPWTKNGGGSVTIGRSTLELWVFQDCKFVKFQFQEPLKVFQVKVYQNVFFKIG